MKDISAFQKSLVQEGRATSTGYVPPVKPASSSGVDAFTSELKNTSQEEVSPSGQKLDFSMKKLVAPTVSMIKGVGNFLSSSEQKLGGIIGDTTAALTGGIEGVKQDVMKENEMLSRVRGQIQENKAQGKDTSHLEWVLALAEADQKGIQERIGEIAPGSQATDKEALGAIGGVALDILSAGTYGSATKGMKNLALSKEAPTAYKIGSETLKRGSKGFWDIVSGGAKTGLKATPVGAAYGVTSAMQDNGSSGDIAKQAAISGGVSFALPVLASLVPAIKQLAKPTTERALKNLEPAYDNMFGRTQTSRRAQAKSARFDNDPTDLLVKKASHGDVVPVHIKDVAGTQVWDTTEGQQKLLNDVKEMNTNLLNPMLKESPVRMTIDDIEKEAIQRLQKTMGDSSEFEGAVAGLRNTLSGYAKAPNFQGGALRLDQINSMKSQEWAKSKVFDQAKPKFKSDVEFQLAETLKDIIERNMPDEAGIRALQKYIGHHLATIEQLSKINNSGVGAQRMGKNFLRTIGAISGGASGGTAGAIGGSMMGDELSKILGRHAASNPFDGKAIEQIQKTNPALIREIIEYLPTYFDDVSGKVQLPPKSAFGVIDLSRGKPVDLSKTKTKVPIKEVSGFAPRGSWVPGTSKKSSPTMGQIVEKSINDLNRAKNTLIKNSSTQKPGAIERAKKEILSGNLPPIKIRTIDGEMFIEDGRHHLEAARQLGIKKYPTEDITHLYE